MRTRSVLMGGLVAGMFLLPLVAGAAVTGICSNCHTMHNSQDGADINAIPNGHLLAQGGGCAGCHTHNGFAAAPQVDLTGTATVYNGGYFNTTDGDGYLHNVTGVIAPDATLTGNVPGGTLAVNSFGAGQLRCEDCHGASGGHHGSSGYRILSNYGTTNPLTGITGNADRGAIAYVAGGAFPGTRSNVTYNSDSIDGFCSSCHPNFHGTGNTGTAAPWIRHPTDISVSASGESSINASPTFDDSVVVGTNAAAATDVVMCLSCHVPHGGPYDNLLAFNYTQVSAGDGNSAVGCEICHSSAAFAN